MFSRRGKTEHDPCRLRYDHPQNILTRHRAVNPAISAVVPVVSEDKILVYAADPHLFAITWTSIGRRVWRQVGLVKQFAVDVEMPIFDKDRVALFGDYAFDGVAVVGRIAEDDDLLGLRIADVIDEAVQHITSRVMQGGGHACANHLNRLQDIVGDELKRAVCHRGNQEAGKNLPDEGVGEN